MSKITFPESLYEQYRDVHVQRPPQHRYFRETVTANNTTLATVNQVIPADQDAIINFCSARILPGAAQALNWCRFEIWPPLYPTDTAISLFLLGAKTAVQYEIGYMDGIMIEAGSQFFITANFTGAVAANSLVANVMYCLYPRMKF